MHAICNIVTDHKPSLDELSSLMNPFFEDDFYDKYKIINNEGEFEDYADIPAEDYPMILWDGWSEWEPPQPFDQVDLTMCFCIIDGITRGAAYPRQWWNGKEHVPMNDYFIINAERLKKRSQPGWYVTQVNVHW